MSRLPKIRWTQSDDVELKRVVRNYNAKRARLKKKYPEAYNENSLPPKMEVRELKELLNTRRDLNRVLNSLKRFSRRGMETLEPTPTNDKLKITKWQRIEANRNAFLRNSTAEKRLNRIKDVQMSDRGKKLGYTREQFGMGRPIERKLEPLKPYFPSMNYRDLHARFNSLFIQSQSDYLLKSDYRLKNNVLSGLLNNYNWEDVKKVYKHIEDMPMEEFLIVFEQDPGTMEMISPIAWQRFNDQKARDYDSYVDALYSTWMPKNKEK